MVSVLLASGVKPAANGTDAELMLKAGRGAGTLSYLTLKMIAMLSFLKKVEESPA